MFGDARGTETAWAESAALRRRIAQQLDLNVMGDVDRRQFVRDSVLKNKVDHMAWSPPAWRATSESLQI
jgi:hypothetical protein